MAVSGALAAFLYWKTPGGPFWAALVLLFPCLWYHLYRETGRAHAIAAAGAAAAGAVLHLAGIPELPAAAWDAAVFWLALAAAWAWLEMARRGFSGRDAHARRLNREIEIYRDAIAQADGVVYQRDYENDRFAYLGEGILRLTGYSRSEMTPQLWASLVAETEMKGEGEGLSVEEAIELTRAGKIKHWRDECLIETRNEGRRWISDHSVEVFGEDGIPIRSIGILQDITERKLSEQMYRMENQVLESIARGEPLDAVLDGLAHGVEEVFGDTACSILMLNPAAGTLSHAGRPSLPAEYVRAVDGLKIGPKAGSCGTAAYWKKPVFVADIESDPLWDGHREIALEAGLRACWSFPIFSGRQTVLGTFALYYKRPKSPPAGKIQQIQRLSRLAGLAIDLRGRDEALREKEHYFRSLIENVRDIIVLLDGDGRVRYASPSVNKTLGYGPGDLEGRVFLDFVHPDDRSPAEASFQRLRNQGGAPTPAFLEVRVKRADGGWKVLEALGNNLLNEPAVAGMIVNARDITDRKESETALRKTEEQLRHSQKIEAVGRLAGGIAHDFNNILTIIQGNCELILVNGRLDEPVRKRLTEMQSAVENASSLTRQLLAFSRQQVMQTRVIDLNEVLRDTHTLLRRIIGEHILIQLDLHEGELRVKADPGQIQQVVMNLSVNARDAMPRGGVIRLGTARQCPPSRNGGGGGQCALLVIEDTGVGMNEDVREHIFEPFFTTKDIGQGSGLGLATVHGIVNQLGGEIEVESEQGQGSVFRIYLPLTFQEEYSRVEIEEALDSAPNTETILLVEDEDPVRTLAENILQQHGFQVFSARDGYEAIHVSRRLGGPPDLLVTDMVMPRMGGDELAHILKQTYPGLRVIYLSGYIHSGAMPADVREGNAAFIHKPFKPAELVRAIRKALSEEPE